MQGHELYYKLYDKDIISDLRIKHEDEERIVFGVKRSHFRITIPKQVTPEIAYLAGAIAGDGSFYLSHFSNRIYPRIRLRITSGDREYLEFLNGLFISNFGAGGRIVDRKRKCWDLHNNHRVIWLYFRKVLGLDKKKLRVPEQTANAQLFRFFLAGFFDTDGYCSNGTFGTMLCGRSETFLRQLSEYSLRFYSFEFSKVRLNTLVRGDKTFLRAYMTLKKRDGDRFRKLIPLRKKKYGPARN